jgi:hypothetical protein
VHIEATQLCAAELKTRPANDAIFRILGITSMPANDFGNLHAVTISETEYQHI